MIDDAKLDLIVRGLEKEHKRRDAMGNRNSSKYVSVFSLGAQAIEELRAQTEAMQEDLDRGKTNLINTLTGWDNAVSRFLDEYSPYDGSAESIKASKDAARAIIIYLHTMRAVKNSLTAEISQEKDHAPIHASE
jgi:hypothetical protein